MQDWAAWGVFWGDSWGSSWGPLHEVEEELFLIHGWIGRVKSDEVDGRDYRFLNPPEAPRPEGQPAPAVAPAAPTKPPRITGTLHLPKKPPPADPAALRLLEQMLMIESANAARLEAQRRAEALKQRETDLAYVLMVLSAEA